MPVIRKSRARWASATEACISSSRLPTSQHSTFAIHRFSPTSRKRRFRSTTPPAIVAALKARFPDIVGPKKDDICYATQNRQDAVKFMSPRVDVVIVVGSPNSSNSNRLREVAANRGVPSYMVDNATQLQPEWLEGKQRVGVSAGASAPELLVTQVIERLRALGAASVSPNCQASSREPCSRCRRDSGDETRQ